MQLQARKELVEGALGKRAADLVLSGEATGKEISSYQPTCILNSIFDL